MQLIPGLIGYDSCSFILRDLLALPCCLGGMGITDITDSQLDASVKVTASLKSLIVHQTLAFSSPDVRSLSKLTIVTTGNKAKVQGAYVNLSQPLQRAMDLNSEKGTSSWLTALLYHDQGFHLTKRELWVWDAIFLYVGHCLTP